MSTLPAGSFENVTAQIHCPWCCDEGSVEVAKEIRPTYNGDETYLAEVYGPCPACEKGHGIEFPRDGSWGPWGKDGFWKGRPWRDHELVKQCRCDERSTTRKEAMENLAKLRAFTASVADAMVVSRRRVAPPEQTRDALNGSGATPAPTGDAGASTGPDTAALISGSQSPAPSGTMDAHTVPWETESHECSGFDPPKTVPYSKQECASCTPASPKEDEDVIPF